VGSVSVKVCGITRVKDANLALELGAEKLGFILHEKSPRKIDFQGSKEIQN
jgi:phosphoribosylanthranilate isomerase